MKLFMGIFVLLSECDGGDKYGGGVLDQGSLRLSALNREGG
jgi:hypothetical protein